MLKQLEGLSKKISKLISFNNISLISILQDSNNFHGR